MQNKEFGQHDPLPQELVPNGQIVD
jgi:hypothetical protein